MTTQLVTPEALTELWRKARSAHKLNGKKLNTSEAAGLLIEELGSPFAALRLVQVSEDAPHLVGLEAPSTSNWRELRDLLIRAWLVDTGQKLPSAKKLMQAWEGRPEGQTLDECKDPKVLAGGLLVSYEGNLDGAIHSLGLALYSPFHFVEGFAKHPLARDILFWLDMALWSQNYQMLD